MEEAVPDLLDVAGQITGRTAIEVSAAGEHHALPPGTLISPLHRHTREDEFSLVLEGRMGVVSDGAEIEAEAGCLV